MDGQPQRGTFLRVLAGRVDRVPGRGRGGAEPPISGKGAVVDTAATGANPHHVEVARGAAYVVDKSASGPEGQDLLHRIRLDR
ncbi:hypothetical protein [Streptomyces kronopolitis]|uniref:hypothetical protein n=1 Tax=Streptomyces kronopolitis TaxID=1612435 RepID=UPI0036B4E00E